MTSYVYEGKQVQFLEELKFRIWDKLESCPLYDGKFSGILSQPDVISRNTCITCILLFYVNMY